MVKRLMNVGWSAAINMLPMLTNLVAAWLVLHFAGDGIWGEFVAIQLLIGLGLHVMAWGNRDYLMRVFALDSGNPIEVWRQVLFSRGVMLFMAMPILLLTYPSQTAILLLLWLFCGFLRQSFEVVLTFRREFAFGALSELASSLFFLVWIWFHADQLGVESLVMGSFLMQALRILPFLAWYGREFLIGAVPQVRFGYFQLALPFFLLGFAGLLITRLDLYCLLANSGPGKAVTKAEIGHYQVWTGLLIYLQSFAAFILLPLMKFVYRLPLRSIWKLAYRMLLWGMLATLVGLPVIWMLMTYWYKILIPWEMYILAIPYVVVVYFMAPLVLYLYKRHFQRNVLLANGASVLLNFGFSILLIPRWGIFGATVAGVAGQLLLIAMVVAFVKREGTQQ
jgi:O-antigen/teichoic acid export membrane protein